MTFDNILKPASYKTISGNGEIKIGLVIFMFSGGKDK